MKKIFLIYSLFFLSFILFSESLWDDKAKDIYNRKVYYTNGDTVKILINETSVLEYKSSTKSLKNFNIDISSKELSGLFTFLPKGSVEETKDGNEKDNLKIQSIIQGRVISVGNNFITLRGTKRITVDNKTSYVEITGDANFKDIIDNSIQSSMLINPTLRVTTLLENANDIINERDLIKVILNPDSTTDKIEETRISDRKKREILINFFNKILNVIF